MDEPLELITCNSHSLPTFGYRIRMRRLGLHCLDVSGLPLFRGLASGLFMLQMDRAVCFRPIVYELEFRIQARQARRTRRLHHVNVPQRCKCCAFRSSALEGLWSLRKTSVPPSIYSLLYPK